MERSLPGSKGFKRDAARHPALRPGVLDALDRMPRPERIETKMRCLKVLGERINAKDPDRQTAGIHIRIALINCFNALGTEDRSRGLTPPRKGKVTPQASALQQRHARPEVSSLASVAAGSRSGVALDDVRRRTDHGPRGRLGCNRGGLYPGAVFAAAMAASASNAAGRGQNMSPREGSESPVALPP